MAALLKALTKQRPRRRLRPTAARRLDAAGTAARRPAASGRAAERPRARRAPAARQRPRRPRHRPRAARVAQHPAHPHQEHLHEARRHQPPRAVRQARELDLLPGRAAADAPAAAADHHPLTTCGDDRSPHRGLFRLFEGRDRADAIAADPTAGPPSQYEIRVEGHLADRWAAWFDGMTLTRGGRRHHRHPRAGRRPGRAARPPAEGPRPRHPARLAHAHRQHRADQEHAMTTDT